MSVDESLDQSRPTSGYSKWNRHDYRRRVGEEEAARHRKTIIVEERAHRLAEQPSRDGGENR